MKTGRLLNLNLLTVILFATCFTTSLKAIEIDLQIEEPLGITRQPALIVNGIPFAKGVLHDTASIGLLYRNDPIPVQFKPLTKWPDGSLRWVLLSTEIPAFASCTNSVKLLSNLTPPSPKQPVKVSKLNNSISIATGEFSVNLSTNNGALIDSIKLANRTVASAGGKGLILTDSDGIMHQAAPPTTIEVEEEGPVKAVVRLSGFFPKLHNGLLNYTLRATVWAGQPRLHLYYWLENNGASGHSKDTDRAIEWFAFKSVALDLQIDLGDSITAKCEDQEATGHLKVVQLGHDGSAGDKLDNRLHFGYTNFQYRISSGENLLSSGARTDGVMLLKGKEGQLTAAIRDFWQTYEKGMEFDKDRLRFWLWPPEGQWPRPGRNLTHNMLRRYQSVVKPGCYLLQGGTHKGHEMVLDFSNRPTNEVHAELSSPLFARATPQHYASAEIMPPMFAPTQVKSGNRECDFKLASWDRTARSIADPKAVYGIPMARQEYHKFPVGYYQDASHWFGWMDFGDICVPGKGQVSLHYDWTLIMLLEYLRGGSVSSLQLATAMAHHRIDIDQFWSDRDGLPEYKLTRRDNAFPTFHFNSQFGNTSATHNWLAGVALWYCLSGEPKALEAALRNGEGIAEVWENIFQTRPYNGPQHYMADNGWAIESFCVLYDLTADKRWLDEAMKLFERNVSSRWKNFGPHLHKPVIVQGQDYLPFDKSYCYFIMPLCGLHARTGNKEIERLLTEGCETPFPESFYDAPMYLAALFAYTYTITDNEAYLKQALNLFAQGFPESATLPVVMPGDNTWSELSAMRLRAAWPIYYALWHREQKQLHEKK